MNQLQSKNQAQSDGEILDLHHVQKVNQNRNQSKHKYLINHLQRKERTCVNIVSQKIWSSKMFGLEIIQIPHQSVQMWLQRWGSFCRLRLHIPACLSQKVNFLSACEGGRIEDKRGRVIKDTKRTFKRSSVLILPPTGVADWDPERLSPMVGRKGGAEARRKEQQIKQRWIMDVSIKEKKKIMGSWEPDVVWWEHSLVVHIKNEGKA